MNGRMVHSAPELALEMQRRDERETAFSPNGPHLPMTIKLRYPLTHTRLRASLPLVRPFFYLDVFLEIFCVFNRMRKSIFYSVSS